MAKIPRPPRSRKRLHHSGIPVTPLRRSRRIAFKEPFRFNDLPPELRNAVYSLIVESDIALMLTDKLPATAQALSQVSRSIRAESLSMFFSANYFTAKLSYWSTAREAQQEVSRIEQWSAVFGELVARHIRALLILHLCILTLGGGTHFSVSSDIRSVDRFTHWDAFFDEYRAAFRARIARQTNHFRWTRDMVDEMDKAEKVYPVGAFCSIGKLRLKPDALQLLLTGLQLVIPDTTQSNLSAMLLSQLD
jgi:hypothetical protein